MTSPDHNLVKGTSVKLDSGLFSRDMAVEPSAVIYLAYCYSRAVQEKSESSVSENASFCIVYTFIVFFLTVGYCMEASTASHH